MKSRLVLAACLIFVLLVSLVMPLATAYADYTDEILNNPTAIVNFNQLVNNDIVNGYTFPSEYNIISQYNFVSTHKIYINFNVVNNNNTLYEMRFHNSDGTIRQNVFNGFKSSSVDTIITLDNNFVDLRIYVATNSLSTNNIKVIDLTQMFGDNEPNLQQCHDLFVADYYSYNSGSAVSLSGINAYVEGYNDAMSTLDVVYNSADLYPSLFSYQTTVFRLHEGSVYFNGIVGLPLGMTLLPNDLITIDFRAILIDTSTTIDFGYLTGSNFVTIASYNYDYFTLSSLRRYGIVSFSIPVNMNTLYIRVLNSSAPDSSACICSTFYLSLRTTNAYSGLKENFDLGYAKAQQYYEKLYARGGTQWTAIYQEGYYAYPTDDHYTFRDLITAAVDTPVQAMTNLFDFDILGVNMKTFYLSIFTLCVIFMILKLVL